MSPARRCAYTVVRRVFEQGAYADRALHAEAGGLSKRDRALATALAYGTVQRKRTLDHLLAPLVSRTLDRLDPPVLASLRLGCFQIAFMDRVPQRAAVHESVQLVKDGGRGGAQLVNAVLRRAARETPEQLARLDDGTPQAAAILHSVPDWLAELWWSELGADEARALLAVINQPAESALRVNTLRGADVELPVRAQPAPELPEGRILEEPFDVYASPLWQVGAVMPQSRGSMLVARTVDPQPGERVLDMCAAPGAKTTHLAALMGGEGEVIAVEVHPGRARALAETCARMGADCVQVQPVDALTSDLTGSFDRVLVDPPCSGLGTLQSRPDLRWQPRRGEIAALSEKQSALLIRGAQATKPGGTLVYSVCTISEAEGRRVVERLLQERSDFTIDQCRQLMPNRDRTDGFFIARLRRA